jgi:hypothetical protein
MLKHCKSTAQAEQDQQASKNILNRVFKRKKYSGEEMVSASQRFFTSKRVLWGFYTSFDGFNVVFSNLKWTVDIAVSTCTSLFTNEKCREKAGSI